jgi:class 3 adenylate cyclase/predicted DNA binding protein
MAVVEARMRVHHPCPYCDLSVEFPRTLLLLWCDNRRDVFLVSSPDAGELRQVLSAFRDSFHGRCTVQDGQEAVVVVPDFEWADPPSVTGLARRTGVWALPPVLYHGGRETYHFVAPSRSELNQLIARVRRLGDVELLSVTDREGLGTVRDGSLAPVQFFEGLTEKQTRAIVAAYEGGLLDVPAHRGWGEVARSQGLSRSTFGEHLRKGQHRLLVNSYPLLKARISAPEGSQVLPALPSPRRTRRTPLQETREPGRLLRTVLFTDIVDSTRRASELGDRAWSRLLEHYLATAAKEVAKFRGKLIKSTGDGVLATFSIPTRAVRCALELRDRARQEGLETRAGLHTGECLVRERDVEGLAVHIASRVSSRAEGGEVLVSGTVRDLSFGSEISFEDRGVASLRGVDGEWRLYRVERSTPR